MQNDSVLRECLVFYSVCETLCIEKEGILFIRSLSLLIVIELAQFIFALGWYEIDDGVKNAAGAMMGYWSYIVIRKNCTRYRGEKRNIHVD